MYNVDDKKCHFCYTANMYRYKLPNGIQINPDRMVDGVLAETEYPQIYLDTETGALVEIPSIESLKKWVEEIGKSKRYFNIDRFNDKDRDKIAESFLEDILRVMEPKCFSSAKKALKKNGWRGMEDFLEENTDGWIHGWDQFIADEAWEYVNNWLTDNPHIAIKAEFEGCGDCAICKLMRSNEDKDFSKLAQAMETENVMQRVQEQMKDFSKRKRI